MFLSLVIFALHLFGGIVRRNCRLLSAFLFSFVFFLFWDGEFWFFLVLHTHQSITLWSNTLYSILVVSPCVVVASVGSEGGDHQGRLLCFYLIFKYLIFFCMVCLIFRFVFRYSFVSFLVSSLMLYRIQSNCRSVDLRASRSLTNHRVTESSRTREKT